MMSKSSHSRPNRKDYVKHVTFAELPGLEGEEEEEERQSLIELKKKAQHHPTLGQETDEIVSPMAENLKHSCVYVFGSGSNDVLNDDRIVGGDNSQEEIPLFEVTRRGPTAQIKSYSSSEEGTTIKPNIILLTKNILPGETLQSISIKFNCRMSELKRVNNLLNEQDFFTLKSIKIPTLENGYLTEIGFEDGIIEEGNVTTSHQASSTRISRESHQLGADEEEDGGFESEGGADAAKTLVSNISEEIKRLEETSSTAPLLSLVDEQPAVAAASAYHPFMDIRVLPSPVSHSRMVGEKNCNRKFWDGIFFLPCKLVIFILVLCLVLTIIALVLLAKNDTEEKD